MQNFAIAVLLTAGLLLPGLLFLFANNFKKLPLILFRAVLAIGAGWAYFIGYAFAAHSIRLAGVVTPSEFEDFASRDGAPLAFAITLGWVIPTVIVGASWVIRFAISKRSSAGA